MRPDNISMLENYLVDAPFAHDQFLEQIKEFVPELDEHNLWIRSGHRIDDRYKKLISSYRLLGSHISKNGRSRIEVLLIKPQPLAQLIETEASALEFIREYQAKNRVDVIFAAIVSASDSPWRRIFTADTVRSSVTLPSDLIYYTATSVLKKYLKKQCSLTDAALDGYFSNSCFLYDDTTIREKAGQIDKALADISVCDISAGTGGLLGTIGEQIAAIRSEMSKYLAPVARQDKNAYLEHFAENSLHATDLDAGALEILKLCSCKTYGKRVPDDHVVYGSVLTEELFGGKRFDVIITNPPHMRQEEFSSIKESFSGSAVFHKSADLYCYYIERAVNMLSNGGSASIITSNRWIRSEYGAPLRSFLAGKEITEILDYGNIPPTKELTTPLSVLVVSGTDATGGNVRVTTPTDPSFDNISDIVENESFLFNSAKLGDGPWVFETNASGIMQKIASAGIPLEKYVTGGVFRGILTGLNEAFVVDNDTAKDLIARDVRSKELLRPFAAGRDVKRYKQPRIRKYLVFIPRGFTDERRGDRAPNDWFADNYPVIAEHLQKFMEKASIRRDKGDYWWELRSCNYYDLFEQGKIISPSIVKRVSASIDMSGIFSNDKTSIIASTDYYLLGLLNSRMMDFYARRICTALLNEHFELKPANLAAMPIKCVSETNGFQTKLRDLIAEQAKKLSELNASGEERSEEASEAEHELNKAVYKLYKLTAKEINFVENN